MRKASRFGDQDGSTWMLARLLRMRELKEVALIEQTQLQLTALHQGADLGTL
jgi:hypothetical protein